MANVQLQPLSGAHKPVVFLGPAFVDQAMQPGGHFYAVFDGPTCVGMVGVRLTPNPETPELFVTTDPTHSNKGFATAAVTEMVRIGFQELGLKDLYARCRPGRAAERIVKKLGFVQCGQGQGEVHYHVQQKNWKA